jgi:glycosyltransferase involved in cell wall biosynthesis
VSIPVSVVIVTKQEGGTIAACLDALGEFDEVVVVDSASRDATAAIAADRGAQVINFMWDGHYPKKRQWVLDNIHLRHDWVFFIDADEIATPELVQEMAAIFSGGMPQVAGYFVTGRYMDDGDLLSFGMANKKIALFDKTKMMFPVVDDLDIPGMGEIEGHYQPIARQGNALIGILKSYLIHHAFDDEHAWAFRHQKYARWEAGMNIKGAWPVDPVPWRQTAKVFLRGTKYRPWIVLWASYFLYLGFLDGRAGLEFALRRFRYYSLIQQKQDELKQGKNHGRWPSTRISKCSNKQTEHDA